MPSPFPGMDPYLESHWGDVHHSFITYARDQLNKDLPDELRARVEERVFVESPAERRPIVPDVRVLERPARRRKAVSSSGSVATAEPFVVPLAEITEGYIEIRDASSGHRVITVIEVLSPSNKTSGDAQEKYLRKRQELCAGRVSLVEIDLLRAGQRLLPFPLDWLPRDYRTPYQAWARRGSRLTDIEVYAVALRQPLPTLPIPLRPTDTDAKLQLQPLLEQCYENGSYAKDIDYRADPEPPLGTADARWADALLRKQGKRSRSRRRNGSR